MSSSIHPAQSALVGQDLHDVPTPAAVIDLSKVQRNCTRMREAVKALGLSFRAHVKTHKTTQLTRLQVGDDCRDVRLVVSTVTEAEQLRPLLLDYKERHAKINVLYGVPIGPSHIPRLVSLGKQLGEGSLTFMIDHPCQLASLQKFKSLAGFAPCVFIKVDSGTHRAGIPPTSPEMTKLIQDVSSLEARSDLILTGFYSHAGHSYAGNSPDEAMDQLRHEISVCQEAARQRPAAPSASSPLVISVGASPTVLSVQNLLRTSVTPAANPLASTVATGLRAALRSTDGGAFEIELHAGVYPLLDMQQLETHARDPSAFGTLSPYDAIALTVLAEVCSLYPARPEQPQALISAGGLALAREPCKDYAGFGVVSPWGFANKDDAATLVSRMTTAGSRLIVARISQEHGILAFEDDGHRQKSSSTKKEEERAGIPVAYGQKLRIWSNHACITSAMFDYYLVVDSASEHPDRIVDVWPRWKGW